LKLQLIAYAQTFLDFVVPPFVASSRAKTMSKTRSGTISLGGVEDGIRTTMEVDSSVAEVATKSTQVALDITKASTKTMHTSTLPTIVETKEGIKNLQRRDDTRIVPMVE
jgi:hypothetical protein